MPILRIYRTKNKKTGTVEEVRIPFETATLLPGTGMDLMTTEGEVRLDFWFSQGCCCCGDEPTEIEEFRIFRVRPPTFLGDRIQTRGVDWPGTWTGFEILP